MVEESTIREPVGLMEYKVPDITSPLEPGVRIVPEISKPPVGPFKEVKVAVHGDCGGGRSGNSDCWGPDHKFWVGG